MFDGRGSDDDTESWREHEQVDERYAEPEESDPTDLGPGVPEPPDPSTNDVDPFLQRRFWALVVVFNVALLALSLAAMFAVFEGEYGLASRLLVVGLVALGFGLYRYRTTKRRLAERSEEASPGGDRDHGNDERAGADGATDSDPASDSRSTSDPGPASDEHNG